MRNFALYASLCALISVAYTPVSLAQTAYCNPERSKPCGMGCIQLHKTCRKSWTTAVSGERPASAKPGYANPKYVEVAPDASTKK